MIDSDDNSETGYAMPGVGADQMIEVYGKNQAVLSSVLYTFNDNRESTDWNGFNALSTTNARSIQNTVEVQVPLFDLGATSSDEIKVVLQSNDNEGNTDLADTVLSLNNNEFSLNGAVKQLINDSNTLNEGDGIVIDGYFGDWNNIEKQFNVMSSAESEHVDLQDYAAILQNDKSYMYMSVSGNILNGISVPAYNAKSMPDQNSESTDSDEPVNGVSNQESTPLPVMSSEDTVYILSLIHI